MSVPTPAQQSQLVQTLVDHAQSQSVSILGFTFDASQLTAIFDLAVAAACMKQWQAAQAAGKAAADSITTAAQAEAELRKP
jgi:hypothetical protein